MSSFTSWQILHLPLHEGVSAIPEQPEGQGAYLVFWWRNIPLGHKKVPATQLPLSHTQTIDFALQTITPTVQSYLVKQVGVKQVGIAAPAPPSPTPHRLQTPLNFHTLISLNHPLDKIYTSQASNTNETISVVIPTRNRPELLLKCIQSLQALAQPPHEIIVVDNAPSSNVTEVLIAQLPQQPCPIRYVLEPEAGASKARNTGIHHATGDLVAFIDDDMTAHPDWLTHLQQSFSNPKVMAVTGLVFPGELETEAQCIFEEYWSFNRGYRRLYFDSQFFEQRKSRGVPVWQMGGSGNMAIRRTVVSWLGGFDERLGGGPNSAGCSEDSEFLYRVLAEGLLCCYEPTAVAYHYHRADVTSLQQQMYGYMRGHVAALLIQFERHQHWGNLYRLIVSLPRWYGRTLWDGLRNRFCHPRYRSLFAEISGCFAGIQFYLRHRKQIR